MPEDKEKIFIIKDWRKKIRSWDGIFHLFSVTCLILITLSFYPGNRNITDSPLFQDAADVSQAMQVRQKLVEALDKIIRYQNYYKEIHGSFSRDITRLGIPENLSSGTMDEVRRVYEISVLEIAPQRVLLLATGVNQGKNRSITRMDRVTMDERHRFNANFILPPPSRSYLYEEGDRLLRLKLSGNSYIDSVYSSYWQLENSKDLATIAVIGKKNPVLNERRSFSDTTLFENVREQLRGRNLDESNRFPAAISLPNSAFGTKKLRAEDVRALLLEAHQAQHIYKRERGFYTRKWEDLDAVTGFQFLDKKQKAANIRFQPIQLAENGYQIILEGTSGELLGEQFQIDQNANVRQVRYTDTLIQQLQKSTEFLESTFKFQISEIPVSSKGVLDRENIPNIKSKEQGRGTKK